MTRRWLTVAFAAALLLSFPPAAAAPTCSQDVLNLFPHLCIDEETRTITFYDPGLRPLVPRLEVLAHAGGAGDLNVTVKTAGAPVGMAWTETYLTQGGVVTCGVFVFGNSGVDNHECIDSAHPPGLPDDWLQQLVDYLLDLVRQVRDLCPNFPRCYL